MNGFELDRCELAEGALATPPVVGPFDPDHDGQAQLLSCLPALTIEDIVLNQRETRFSLAAMPCSATSSSVMKR